MKVNYKKLFDEEINKIKASSEKPKLLLHACCAPCSSAVLEMLSEVFDITLYFHNPNIFPESEFSFRLSELKRLLNEMNLGEIKIIAPEYNSEEFFEIAKGYENFPEGGERCERCFRLRLEKTVLYAKENKFDYFTTTLSISPYKNAGLLNEIGIELEEKHGVKHLFSDFKKGDGYKRSCYLSKEFDLYRQDYCGCIYSKRERENLKIKE